MRRSTLATRSTTLAMVIAAALALAGCNTDGNGPGASMASATPPEPPMTHQRAAAICWAKTEKGAAASADLDKRADIVTKCIADKMKAAPKA
jgi:hypothetical protein